METSAFGTEIGLTEPCIANLGNVAEVADVTSSNEASKLPTKSSIDAVDSIEELTPTAALAKRLSSVTTMDEFIAAIADTPVEIIEDAIFYQDDQPPRQRLHRLWHGR